ncbi:sensor domain-containing diguanylate cyclase [Gottfriedia acidiceleris]|uniref:Diguanylate cyclase n=1 Tax=Gottfriedia acidiceleris TaxID=371036 RepID=A0ABY4JTM8_9BACI|nr:sensor domain-containing diguanylate cyclase [Gottfriedia acidiceleris]UPM56183.1 diguanylate cyclase [Gottfriedia acidiceleris]
MNRKRIPLLLVILVSIIFVGSSLYYFNKTETTKFEKSFNIDYHNIQDYSKTGSDFTEVLKIYSNEFLNKDESNNAAKDTSYIHYDPIKKEFNSDSIKDTLSENKKGNITGIGKPNDNPVKFKEILLADRLNNYFSEIYSSYPEITWIYYTSISGFNNLYPFVPSNEFKFSNELLKEESTTLGTIETNPYRKPYWSSPYLDSAGKGMMVTVSSPVDYKQRYVGSISIDITFENLSRELNKDYTAILSDNEGNIIASSNKEFLSSNKIINMTKLDQKFSKGSLAKINTMQNETLTTINGMKVLKCDFPGTDWTFYYILTTSALLKIIGMKILPILFITILLVWITWIAEKRMDAEKKLKLLVNDLEFKKNELEDLSSKDPLTGVLNRRGLHDLILSDLEKTTETELNCSFLIFDIDNFKKINDQYGHTMGDFVLNQSAKLIKELIRNDDYLGRWGGEEFLIVLPNTPFNQSKEIAERLRCAIEEHVFHFESINIHVTMTFGLARFNSKKGVVESINRADKAMYVGKQNGKNCVICYEDLNGETPSSL